MSPSIHHITLTVRDVRRSAEWYQLLLGEAETVHREGDGWIRIRMAWPDGLIIGVTQFQGEAPERFSHLCVGLDHLGLKCRDEQEVRSWATRMDQHGIEHGPVEEAPYGWAVTARDPDNIPIEFFSPRR